MLTASEIRVAWDPVQQLSANGILRGYEVGPARPTETHRFHKEIMIIIIIRTIALFGILRTALSFYSRLFY